jgi:hypothetical protein
MRSKASRWGAVALACAGCVLAGRAGAAPKELGLNVHQSVDVGLDATRDLGGTWVRIDFNWFQAEPKQGQIDFKLYDAIVDGALGRGLKVLAVIGYTPAWASSGNVDGKDTLNDVPKPGTYAPFVTASLKHFAGRVTHWELWNEPNLEGFFEGTPQQYVDLILKPGADAVHAACATCKVVAPDLATVGGKWDVWMQAALTQAGDKIDIVSGHVYASFPDLDSGAGKSSPSFLSKLEQHRVLTVGGTVVLEDPLSLRELMVKYGAGSKPFWMTETGQEAAYGDAAAGAKQATYVRHVLEAMLTRPWWTTTIFYEAFDEPQSGYTWGFVLHEASAPGGYRCKPVCELFKKARSKQPLFGGNGADCNDGLDNEGDGKIDWPADPDCMTALSVSEGVAPLDGGAEAGGPEGGAGGADAAVSAEGGVGAEAGPGAVAAAPAAEQAGCGCAAAGRPGPFPGAVAGFVIALGLATRRARRRRPRARGGTAAGVRLP